MSMANPVLFFVYFSFFSNTNITEKTVGFREIWSVIVGVEGEHADHSTTTTQPKINQYFYLRTNAFKT